MDVSGRRQVGSDDVSTGIICDPCKGEDEEENAVFYCTVCNEFFCNTCAKAHGKLTVSKHHHLLDRDSMPKQKFTSSVESMCTKHNGKLIEYYCKIHEDCCCSVCVTLEHKQCEVEYIDDIAIEFGTSTEYTSLMTAIADLTQLLQNTRVIVLTKKDDVGNIYMTFVSEVTKFRSEINQILDSLEKSTLIEAQTVRDNDTKSTESAPTTCDTTIAVLNEMSSNMEKQKKYKHKRQLIISAKRADNQIKQFERLTTELNNLCTIRDYTFRPNETISKSLNAVNSLGNLENKMKREVNIERKSKTSEQRKSVSLRYVGDITIQHSTDTSWFGCLITGGVMLDNNMLALVDRNNWSVKIVDVKKDNVVSGIILHIQPRDITRVEQEQIVVTCDDKLVFIKVGKTLSVMKEVVVGGRSRGIVYTKNTFICSFEDSGCIKIIDLGGKILKTITTVIRTKLLWFDLPFQIALSTDQNTLYVSDSVNGSVTSMDLDGNVHHVYTHANPIGVAVDREDNIYIAGWSSKSIHITSPQFTTIQVLQDGTSKMRYPWTVIYCERDNILYTSHYGNSVSVYQIE